MKIRKTGVLIILPLIVLFGAVGYFGPDFFGDTSGPGGGLPDATTYESGPFRVTVAINPTAPEVGENRFTVKVADSSGEPVTGASIRAFGEMAAMATMNAMRAPADLDEVAPGLYAGPLELEMSGEWPLSLIIQKQGVGETRLGFDMATGREGLSITSGGTPVAKAMAQDSSTGEVDGSMAAGKSPKKNDQGFYTVGKYQVKVEVLTSGETISEQGIALMAGGNRLQVTVHDLDDKPVDGATVRVAAQLETVRDTMDDSMQQDSAMMRGNGRSSTRNSEVERFEPAGNGVYRGALTLPSAGAYALAVDVSTEAKGHGDLVLAFTTGKRDLRAATATPEGIAYYTCSMHSSVREAGPGSCPICSMDLVPVTREQVQSGVITIDARRRQLIGVKTGEALLRELTKTVRAVGKIDYDERQISNVTLKFDAWIGDLEADYVGARVERGQVLFTVYSPELLSAQQEYLETRMRLASRGPDDSLVQAARRRLMLWDVSAEQVAALEQRGRPVEYLPIVAPKSGTVVEKKIVEGSNMKTGDMLLRIADLSTVWVDAEVYEADLPLVTKGMPATITLPYAASDPIPAYVDYIYPYLDRDTRTARIRLVPDNAEGALKPDMYAEVELQANLGTRLVVPQDAVLVAGRSRVVFKDLSRGERDAGKLQPVRVKTGYSADGWIEITEGLNAGDRVITSGNFLIAAEAKLQTGINQW